MDLAALALTFGAIFVVELPDKTFLATLVLATKYRPILVWIGVGAAFAVQTTVAVLLGHAAGFLPESIVHFVAMAMFAVGAVVLLREGLSHHRRRWRGRGGVRCRRQPGHGLPRRARVVPRAVRRGVGRPVPAADDLAGRPLRRALEVFIGALGALLVVSGLAVVVGRTLLRYVALHWLHYVGAAICAGLAVLTLVELVR